MRRIFSKQPSDEELEVMWVASLARQRANLSRSSHIESVGRFTIGGSRAGALVFPR